MTLSRTLAVVVALPTIALLGHAAPLSAAGCVANAYISQVLNEQLFVAYNSTEYLDSGQQDTTSVVSATSRVYQNSFSLVATDGTAEANGYTAHEYYIPHLYNRCYTNEVTSIAYLRDNSTRSCYAISAPECIGRPPKPPLDNCPIVLDLGMNGLRLSGPSPAVTFDIHADGHPIPIAWTAANSDDAFLVLDRNGNGVVDDGTELFGYATPLASGAPAQVGFLALAEYDTLALGGNQDGVIDARDAVFAHLTVWRDLNRNGITDSGELRPLSSTPVKTIGTRYVTSNLTDGYGNAFRYVGWTTVLRPGTATATPWPAYDVIFASAPQP
ncbi:MAG: hypothetical protein ABI609_15825 [Acidobacteriota bacterium]